MKYKYNFKKFFNDKQPMMYNDKWVSNAHFIVKKELLRKPQSDFIAKFEQNVRINTIIDILNEQKDNVQKLDYVEFIPSKIIINFKANSGDIFNVLINKDGYAIKEEYYNFIMDRKCILSIVNNDKTGLLHISKEGEIVGALCLVRINEKSFKNAERIIE